MFGLSICRWPLRNIRMVILDHRIKMITGDFTERKPRTDISIILDRRILPERNVELYHSEFDEFKIELER